MSLLWQTNKQTNKTRRASILTLYPFLLLFLQLSSVIVTAAVPTPAARQMASVSPSSASQTAGSPQSIASVYTNKNWSHEIDPSSVSSLAVTDTAFTLCAVPQTSATRSLITKFFLVNTDSHTCTNTRKIWNWIYCCVKIEPYFWLMFSKM